VGRIDDCRTGQGHGGESGSVLAPDRGRVSEARSQVLKAARRAGQIWVEGTAQSTKDRLRESHTVLFEAMEELAKATTRGRSDFEI